VGVELDNPHRGVVGGLRSGDRRPRHRRRRAASTMAWSDRSRAFALTPFRPLGSASGARLSQPELHAARPGKTTFTHVLAVEMERSR